MTANNSNHQLAYFAAGCFWCVEAVFQRVAGVISVQSGYANGMTANPDYQAVCRGDTGYAETIKIVFDPAQCHYLELLKVFFKTHDPTKLNRQGADVGTQYRSGVYYVNDAQKTTALEYIASLSNRANIVTEVEPLRNFYPAEDYHQNYFNNHPKEPYCQYVIAPKLAHQ